LWRQTRSSAPVALTWPAVLFLLAVLSSQAFAASQTNQYVIFGAGSRPCGSWLQLRSQALPDSAVLQSWVLGYVTSVNANLLSVNQDVTGGAVPDALFSWIDNYCAAHPLDSLARAAGAMLDSYLAKSKVK
jgi:hypothetical protein